MVNFIYQFNWAKGCPGSLISSVIMRMFLEEIIIWICKLRKEDCLYPCGWASFNPVRAWIEQKCWKKDEFDISAWQGHQSSFTFRHLCFWFLGLLNWTWTYTIDASGSQVSLHRLNSTTGFPGSQLVDERSWDLMNQSQESIAVINLLLSISLYFIWNILWRTLT